MEAYTYIYYSFLKHKWEYTITMIYTLLFSFNNIFTSNSLFILTEVLHFSTGCIELHCLNVLKHTLTAFSILSVFIFFIEQVCCSK